jgi:EmrB/QacA subfamily drug resistance transporter
MAKPSPAHVGPTLSTPRIVTNPWIILIVLALGFFMILLDTTIVNVAIPSIIDGIHASLDQVLWILNAYILVYAVLLITAGRLGDMLGPKKLFISGMILFTLASMACGLAQTPNQLILFRVIQAIGGALLTPQSLSLIASIFPPERRGAAFGLWGGVAGLASVAGPTLGGFLTTTFSWRAIFYVNLPIGIVALTLAVLVMPELNSHRRHQLDIVGVLLASAGLFALVFGLIEGERYSWGRISDMAGFSLGSFQAGLISIPSILLAAVLLLGAFLVWEAHVEEPLLPLSLFKERNFSVANLVQTFVAFAMLGLFLPFTIYLQSVRGFSAEQAGIVMVPMSLTMMFVAPFAGRLTDRISGKWVLSTGMILFAAGMGLIIRTASASSVGTDFTVPLILAGIGMGCTFAPLTALAMRTIAPAQAGAASGFLNTVRQVGGALGSAIVGAVLQNRLASEMTSQAIRYSAQLPAQFRDKFIAGFSHSSRSGLQVGRGQTGGGKVPTGLPANVARHVAQLGQQVFHTAYINAMHVALALPVISMALGAVLTLVFMHSQKAAQQATRSSGGVAAAGE